MSKIFKTVALYKICGVFSHLHAINMYVSWLGSEPRKLMTSYDAWALYELRVWSQLEITVYLCRIVVSCLIHNVSVLMANLLGKITLCQLLWLARKVYEILPGHLSLEKQNTVCWSKGNDCSVVGLFAGAVLWAQCNAHFLWWGRVVPYKRWSSGTGSLCDS